MKPCKQSARYTLASEACVLALVASISLIATPVYADSFGAAPMLQLGSGAMFGSADNATALARSRLFLDAGARLWVDEEPEVVWCAILRAELETHPGVAIVPRVELEKTLGGLRLRPAVGFPMFFAPFSMIGIEGALTAYMGLGTGLGLIGSLLVDGFFFGSDLPTGSALVMVNFAIGVEITM